MKTTLSADAILAEKEDIFVSQLMHNIYISIRSLWCTCVHCYRMSKYAVREQRMRHGVGEGREGISRPTRMKYCCEGEGGSLVNHEWTRDFPESYFTLLKLKKHRKCTSVQKSEDYKTLMLILLGEITFVIGPDCIFVNLWGTFDSSVLQCTFPQWAGT